MAQTLATTFPNQNSIKRHPFHRKCGGGLCIYFDTEVILFIVIDRPFFVNWLLLCEGTSHI